MAEGLCAPFDHNLVIDRLRDQAKVLRHIGGAAELGTITQLRDFRTPAAYVLLAQETLSPKPAGHAGGATRQMVTVHFIVTLAVRSYRDNKGVSAADDLRPVLDQVRQALIGWTPPGLSGARDCQLVQGQVVDYDASVLIWTDLYQTQHAIGRPS
ncbi:Gp37 family protein [Pseudomonas aeruginosa]|uniref:Gp37 family protein n=1 Tax=Pseudomonas aeruginosa TaxID=287 RepID=UPI001F4B48D0|nr:Gp37 family protein [Pseudomonas aeruginosa]